MGLTWEEVEASAQDRQSDRHGVNVWPYASAMLDESSQVKSTTKPSIS